MKTLKYIVWGALIFLWVFYVIPVGLLQVPYIQDKISKKASEILHEKLGVETKIGNVDFELFNKLILKDLYLADQSGDTLFQAKRLSVGFEFTPLFKGKFRFRSAQLFSFQFNLSKETADAPLNLQFVLDAFASKDTIKKKSNIDVQIQKLNLRRGNFSYRVKDAIATPGRFNAKNIQIKDLAAKIDIKTITNHQLIANFSHFAFAEQSGFTVQRLTFDLSANDSLATMNQLELKLPNSLLKLKQITANYSIIEHTEDYIKKTLFDMQIESSKIHPKDISAFVPIFTYFKDDVTIEGFLSGNMDDLKLTKFFLQDKNHLMIQANTELKNMTSSNEIYIQGSVEESYISAESIQRMANNFSEKPVELPLQIKQMGNIKFEGQISGFLHDLSAYGIFQTNIGTLRTDINIGKEENLFIKGTIVSSGVDFKKLMDSDDYGNASFSIQVDAEQDKNKQFSGKINATIGRFEYKGYSYENMALKGAFTPSGFSGNFDIESPEGNLSAEGLFVFKGEHSEFNFSAIAEHIKLDRLHLNNKYKESDLSFNVKADFSGNTLDNLLGNIDITDVRFSNEKGGYYLDTLNISASQQENEKLLIIQSDLVNGEVRGVYSFTGIVPEISQTLSSYIPTFFQSQKLSPDNINNFSINFTIEDTQEFSYIMDLPFVLFNKTNIVGQYNSIYDKFRIECYSPRFSFGKSIIEGGTVLVENPGNNIHLQANGVNLQKNDKKLTFSLALNAANDLLDTQIKWDINQDKKYAGTLAFSTLFTKPTKQSPLKTDISIHETSIVLNDSTWVIHPATVVIDSGKVQINNLKIDHTDQYVQIDGAIAHLDKEVLQVNLNKVNLEYVFNSLNISALDFGGIASGYVNVQDIYKTRKLSTNLDVRNFAFNKTNFGDLRLEGLWDDEQQGIIMNGNVFKDDTTNVRVDGIIYPVKEELSIFFDAQNADAKFLQKYMKNIAKDVSGKLTGKLHLFGDLNNPTIEGDVFVRNGRFGIDFLNTYYTFNDTVRCRPSEIIVKEINFYDKNGWAALGTGSVKHDHFSKFSFSANFLFDNFLVFNATEKLNPNFYGTVYGTGMAKIQGTEKTVNIDVSMQNTKNTKLSLNFMEENDIVNYDFIHFLNKKKDTTSLVEKYFSTLLMDKSIFLKTNTGTDIRFTLNLDATPDAQVDLIMDPLTGDKIRTYGSGHMHVQYGSHTPLRMVGNYAIERGKYNFSFQQVIFREFDIREGSSVTFHGNPYAANFDINASYTTMANLADLNADLVNYAGRTSVNVNCVLNITGAMEHPNIKFNIEIPESEYLERQVKNYINTEDMMNRQMIYLLVLNRFSTPENTNTSAAPRINDFSSLASSTLSSSLSSILSSFTDNIKLGTRFRMGDDNMMTGTEVELMLSSQLLDNRLILNGNFGYRDYSYMTEDTKLPPFVGDFDLEYKLNPRGTIRLKAYNHYNYRYYYDYRAKTTQGLGVVFRKDFERIDELFGKKRFQPTLNTDTIQTSEENKKADFIQFKK